MTGRGSRRHKKTARQEKEEQENESCSDERPESTSRNFTQKSTKRKATVQSSQGNHDGGFDNDELQIRKYAKLLRLDKRKGKGLPKAFVDDGWAELLDLCEAHENDLQPSAGGDSDGSGDEDAFDDEAQRESRPKRRMSQPVSNKECADSDASSPEESASSQKKKKKVHFAANIHSSPDSGEEEASSSSAGKVDEVKEDIYGRPIRSGGTLLTEKDTCKLRILPTSTAVSSEANADLVKEMKRLINRVSEFSVVSICGQVNRIYESHPKHAVKEVFTEIVFQCCARPTLTPPRLCLVQCLLVALLHSNCSSEISSFFVEHLVLKAEELRRGKFAAVLDDSSINNVYMQLSYLYALKVLKSELLVDLLKELADSFLDKDVQLLVLCFQSVGHLLHKEKSVDYKNFVSLVQERCNSGFSSSQTYLKAMASDLMALCGSKGSRGRHCDPSLVDEFVRLLRGNLRDKRAEPPLPFRLMDILKASEKGRWWVVGSSFENNQSSTAANDDEIRPAATSGRCQSAEYSDEILRLAKVNRMNSDLRRSIFCTIMSAEDYVDAFEKLLKIGLTSQQEREIVYILFTCCANEQPYNPFYGYVLGKFCQFAKRFVLTTQFAVWDKLKVLGSLQTSQRKNLALLIKQLIATSAISLKVLKAVKFENLDGRTEKLMKFLLLRLFLECTPERLKILFAPVTATQKYKVLCSGLSIFLKRIVCTMKKCEGDDQTKLKDRIQMVEEVLRIADRNLL